MTRKEKTFEEFIYCGCKCGKTRPLYDNWGRKPKYIFGHGLTGKKRSKEIRRKIGESRKGKYGGEKNPMYGRSGEKAPNFGKRGEELGGWKGDDVGYKGLHKWVRKYLPKPEKCHLCKKREPTEVACITGIYNRDFKNWAWFCHRCNIVYDNVGVRVWITRKNKNKLPETGIIPLENFFK